MRAQAGRWVARPSFQLRPQPLHAIALTRRRTLQAVVGTRQAQVTKWGGPRLGLLTKALVRRNGDERVSIAPHPQQGPRGVKQRLGQRPAPKVAPVPQGAARQQVVIALT